MTSLSRRRFCQLAGAGAALAAAPRLPAIEAFARTGPPAMRLGLAAYSFRNEFKYAARRKEPAPEAKLEMPQFIDYCAEHGCAGAELTSYFFPPDVTPEYLRNVRRHAFLRGVGVSGTSVGNNFALPPGEARDAQIADVKKWIDHAAILGAPHIRIFAGAAAKGIEPAEARRQCISAIEECCEYAGKAGIFLGLENHGGIVAEPEQLLEIVKAVKSPWFGVNLDTGNFHTADPYAGLALCAPYAVNVQVKTEMRPTGAKGPVPADLPRVVQILRDARYQGWVTLEYEGAENAREAVPRHLATLAQLLDGKAAPGTAKNEAELPLFDGKTLEGWKITDFSGRGDVKVEKGQIVLDAGNDITGINYVRETPKMNYEVSLQAMRIQGSDFFCALTFPVREECVTFVVGGWGGSVVGVSSVNGDDASENETTQFVKFDANKWYQLRVRVTEKKIECWIDNDQIVNLETEGKRLSMRPGEIESSMPFGIATFQTAAALREIKLKKLGS
jgi:sugar phosphate isomerase/epimerase